MKARILDNHFRQLMFKVVDMPQVQCKYEGSFTSLPSYILRSSKILSYIFSVTVFFIQGSLPLPPLSDLFPHYISQQHKQLSFSWFFGAWLSFTVNPPQIIQRSTHCSIYLRGQHSIQIPAEKEGISDLPEMDMFKCI